MKYLIKLLVSAVSVLILAEILPGIALTSYSSAIIVALVIAVLNIFVRPLLILFTLPVTILTLGLFLLVINAAIILLADYLIGDFNVDGWIWALIFSLLLSVLQSVLQMFFKKDKK